MSTRVSIRMETFKYPVVQCTKSVTLGARNDWPGGVISVECSGLARQHMFCRHSQADGSRSGWAGDGVLFGCSACRFALSRIRRAGRWHPLCGFVASGWQVDQRSLVVRGLH